MGDNMLSQLVYLQCNNLYIKVPNGDLWLPVEAPFCQPAGTYQRAATKRRCCTATLFTLHYLAPSSLFQRGRTVKWYFGNI